MKTILELCEIRDSIFNPNIEDDVLSINDINNSNNRNKLNTPEKALAFFEENYITEGMHDLFDSAFKRFNGQRGSTNIIKLTQSMGGGKTHNMTALGLLAKYPEIRTNVLGENYKYKNYREIKVVAINGRNVDMEFGIWGEIAKQLRNEAFFRNYYTPLKAPGQETWLNFFKETLNGEPLLILLDELPPYLDNAESIAIGDSNLARVTATALTNLFVATGDNPELSNICIVISDLNASYNNGSEMLKQSFSLSTLNLDNESNRYAKDIQPISSSTNDIYEILRKRLFKKIPDQKEIGKIQECYKKLIRDARDAGYTNLSPDYMNQISSSYPFHPCFKGITSTFKGNSGFQQTRDLLRLMRNVVIDLYNTKKLGEVYLIGFSDVNLKNSEIVEQVKSINNNLENALSHDISSNGDAVSEYGDLMLGFNNNLTQSLSKLIFFSSLSDNINEKKGLSKSELIGYGLSPYIDIQDFNKSLEYITSNAWYLHESKDGTLLFKNVENLIARVNGCAKQITPDSELSYTKTLIEKEFSPTIKDCYQKLLVLPDINKPIELKDDLGNALGDKKSTILVILDGTKDYAKAESAMNELFNAEFCYKNRIIFLVGKKDVFNYSMDTLKEISRKLKAIDIVTSDYNKKNKEMTISENEQLDKLKELKRKEELRFKECISKIFKILYYPKGELKSVEIELKNASYEIQIKDALIKVKKFIDSNSFKDVKYNDTMFNQRIFTQKSMSWNDIEYRVATTPNWIFHHPKELDNLKSEMLSKDLWREINGIIEKGPFFDDTSLKIKKVHQCNDTGETTLTLTPELGDEIYMKKTGSSDDTFVKLDDFTIKTKEASLTFRCVDSTGTHETGSDIPWNNKIMVKYEIKDDYIILKAVPGGEITYAINGNSIITNGVKYSEPIRINPDYNQIMVRATLDNVLSDIETIKNLHKNDTVKIKPSEPVRYKKRRSFSRVADIYSELDALKKSEASVSGIEIQLSKDGDISGDYTSEIYINKDNVSPDKIDDLIKYVKDNVLDESYSNINLELQSVSFNTGSQFKEYLKTKDIPESSLNVSDIDQ